MAFEQLKERQAAAWGGAQFELLADTAADIHDDLVDRLGVSRGERWLDVATGTGAVAIRAARRGAEVTGQDLAAGLIETAARLAATEDLQIDFEVGDAEQLPYPDASFDVVSSAQGAIFAPDHHAVARELARVCRAGGRLGLTAWRPGGAIEQSLGLMADFLPPPPEGAGSPIDWGRREYAERQLGESFELEFFDGESPQEAESPEALWELLVTALGPMNALSKSLPEDRLRELHDKTVAFYSGYLDDQGRVSSPREYVVIVGRRRG